MQTALYGKIKERKSEWLIGANTQNVLYLSIIETQHKTRQRRVRRVEDYFSRLLFWIISEAAVLRFSKIFEKIPMKTF